MTAPSGAISSSRTAAPTHTWTTRAGVAGFAVFALLTLLVHRRVLVDIDFAAARAKEAVVGGFFDLWSAGAGIVLSAEFSVAYALIASYLLWQAGLGRWAFAPLAWLPLVPVELFLKMVIYQPGVPEDLYRTVYYPLTTLTLHGAYPSGHALRTGFLCTFAAVLLHARGGALGRLAPFVFTVLALMLGFARIYLGYHWLSDVVAGLTVGASMALFVAPTVAGRLWRATSER